MPQFDVMTQEQIAHFAVEHQDEFGASGIEASDVLGKLQNGKAALETRPYGFALLELTAATGPGSDGKFIPHLWILFIDRENRTKGLGARFLKDLLRKYARDYHMSLFCHGARRRKFFGRFGFRVESRDGEMRRMTTNDYIR